MLVGCGMHDPIVHRLLEQGEGMSPRARMHSLDSVEGIIKLSTECQCNYFYLRAKARYDLGRVHGTDTLLLAQADYFKRHGESVNVYVHVSLSGYDRTDKGKGILIKSETVYVDGLVSPVFQAYVIDLYLP